jgi:hypothetical protein
VHGARVRIHAVPNAVRGIGVVLHANLIALHSSLRGFAGKAEAGGTEAQEQGKEGSTQH